MSENWASLLHMFLDQSKRYSRRAFLWQKQEGRFVSRSWGEVRRAVIALAAALRENGLKKGDRVILLSENRPEWAIADLAIMMAGGITVPVYTTNTPSDHDHIVDDSGASAAIVSTKALAGRFLPVAHGADRLRFIIAIEDFRIAQQLNVDIIAWDDILEAGPGAAVRDRLLADARATTGGDTACLIYTSGTGGAPKGVMIRHGGILHNCRGAADVVAELGLGRERFLCFLPLSHAYEHTGGLYLPIYLGADIYYAESLDKLAANIQEVRPTIMTVVPRLFELLRSRIVRRIEKQGEFSKKLFHRAVELGARKFRDPGSLTLGERLMNRLLDILVRRKAGKRFGGKLKAMVSGGAPLSPDVGYFFAGLGLPVLQGYGQTEASPVVSVNRPGNPRMDTVGPPLRDTEVRIADDGEILVRGGLVMKGYWNNDEATAQTIVDGWLHTGDIGRIEADGHLRITDRKKDIIVNDKGDNCSPQRIEGLLTLEPEIAQAMVYGDRRPHLVGLIVPDMEWLESWAKNNGKSDNLGEVADDRDLRRALDAAVTRVNKRLSSIEKVRRFAVAPRPFTIENSQMTPTMKIRRHIISDEYRAVLEGLY